MRGCDVTLAGIVSSTTDLQRHTFLMSSTNGEREFIMAHRLFFSLRRGRDNYFSGLFATDDDATPHRYDPRYRFLQGRQVSASNVFFLERHSAFRRLLTTRYLLTPGAWGYHLGTHRPLGYWIMHRMF